MILVVDVKPMQIICPFTDEEIFIAKMCKLNKLSRPPNYYNFYDNNDNKSMLSNQVSSKQVSQFEKSLESAKKDLSDFSKVIHRKEPYDRGKVGSWILDRDLVGCFEYIQIYHNPEVFNKSEFYIHRSSDDLFNNFSLDTEIVVFNEILEEYETQDSQAGDSEQMMTKFRPDPRKRIKFVLGFNPNSYAKTSLIQPYCILQKFDFNVSNQNCNAGIGIDFCKQLPRFEGKFRLPLR